MINSLLESIGIALYGEFGDRYIIYTESVEQGLQEPCFFVSCISPGNRVFLGKRYLRQNEFCLQYFPSDADSAREECNAVTERLYSCLEYIDVLGDLVRGTKMHCEVVDKVLHFFVSYDFFVYRASNLDAMEEMEQALAVKGEGEEHDSKKEG